MAAIVQLRFQEKVFKMWKVFCNDFNFLVLKFGNVDFVSGMN